MPDGNQQVQVRESASISQEPITPRQDLIRLSDPRLPWHPQLKDRFGVDAASWRALIDAVWPAAKSVDAVVLALSYCKARNLDPFKRPVHIVPIWSKELSRMVESVWPGIGELRTTAFRTGLYGGRDKPEFGPDKTLDLGGVALTFPEWCELTVYRLSRLGERLPYPGPRVYWLEAYATAKRDTVAPNDMWRRRPRGQLEKCAEAAALRAAFPEELGNEYSADEMTGQMIEHAPPPPRPRPEEHATGTASEPEAQQYVAPETYEVIDFAGEAHEYATEIEAMGALARLIDEARSLRALDGLEESNPAYAHYPSILEAFKDQKEAFSNPGDRQDRPATGAQQTDPERGATDTAGTTGPTEHPEARQATPSERSSNKVSPSEIPPRDEPDSLAVDLARYKALGDKTNWDGVAAEMEARIAKINDPADAEPQGRFIQQNRQTLEGMRTSNKTAWSTVNYRLNDRYRVLMGGEP